MKEIITKSHQENWKVCNDLIKKGFNKCSDAFWTKIFRNFDTKEEVVVIFEYKWGA